MGIKIRDLKENKDSKKAVPHASGVYMVKVPEGMGISFKQNPDGKAAEDENIYDDVVKKWNNLKSNGADLSVLYCGKAKDLRKRIMQYVRYGYGTAKNHAGGRSIWYVEGNRELEFEFYETGSEEEALAEETRLIVEYKEKYGDYPLANEQK